MFIYIPFKQTRCSKGCSTNNLKINSLMNKVSNPFVKYLQNTVPPKVQEPGVYIWENVHLPHLSCVMCEMSLVICHMLCVMYHMLRLTINMSCVFLIYFLQCGGASWWRVCYQRGLPHLVIFILLLFIWEILMWKSQKKLIKKKCSFQYLGVDLNQE